MENEFFLISLLGGWNRLSLVNVEETNWLLIGLLLSDIIACGLMIVDLLQVLNVVITLDLSQGRRLDDTFLYGFCLSASYFEAWLILNHVLEFLLLMHLWTLLWSLAQF